METRGQGPNTAYLSIRFCCWDGNPGAGAERGFVFYVRGMMKTRGQGPITVEYCIFGVFGTWYDGKPGIGATVKKYGKTDENSLEQRPKNRAFLHQVYKRVYI